VNETRELLARLAAHDERCLRAVLAPRSRLVDVAAPSRRLDRTVRALVELAALLAADATTPSLRCAVDYAAASGADDRVLVGVLQAAASVSGTAQTVKNASRLALALDVDTESDSAIPAARRRGHGQLPQTETRPPAFGRRRGLGS
jgi:alkylhydroperoxidase/carboxymuconolactone decarboxylase family protein YurZ